MLAQFGIEDVVFDNCPKASHIRLHKANKKLVEKTNLLFQLFRIQSLILLQKFNCNFW